MNVIKVRQAIARLEVMVDELPKGGQIEEKYVQMYHRALTEIQSEMGEDLSYFTVPESELEHRVTSVRLGNPYRGGGRQTNYSKERFCDRERFLIEIKGAIRFINSLILDKGANTLPLIEPQ